ncbi:sigma 54-interacting transcriptional regulator [Sphingorhabdus arenilitoris]|uniref:Sigma 54-interacting transcriptional regulator n=1 Tax=Sphingorhabdus arenilitoris TaxID=1490041 RepID=A0ABV8RD65_9SPHN
MYNHRTGRGLLTQVQGKGPPGNIIIGRSDAAHSLRQMVALAAGSNAPLLITGPAGSGKTVTARAVHAASAKRNGPFIRADCSGLGSDAMMTLFGIGRDGIAPKLQRKSYLQMARGGSILFNEIADLPRDLQAVLQQILSGKPVPGLPIEPHQYGQIRIIASTRQALGHLIGEDQFRQDLYYSLSLLSIPVPPLRHRRTDILTLIEYFLMPQSETKRFTLDREALQLLGTHFWPGNIRELRNLVARACHFYPGAIIGPQQIGALLRMGDPATSHATPARPRHAETDHTWGRMSLPCPDPGCR